MLQIGDKKVYLSPVMDLLNREIISYSLSTDLILWQIRERLEGLFDKLSTEATPIFHSDQSWQYQRTEYQQLLSKHNITQSIQKTIVWITGLREIFSVDLKLKCSVWRNLKILMFLFMN